MSLSHFPPCKGGRATFPRRSTTVKTQTGLIGAAAVAGLWLAGGLLTGAGKKDGPDRDFVLRVASKGLAEVQLAQTALDQAKTPEVKKYAARMFQDHKA